MPLTKGARRRRNNPYGTDVNGSLVAYLKREVDLAIRARDEAAASAAHDELIRAERELAMRQAVRRFTRNV